MFCFFTVQTIDKLERDRLLLFLNALIKHKVAVYFRFSLFRVWWGCFFLSDICIVYTIVLRPFCDRMGGFVNGKSKVLFKLTGQLNIKELYLCTFIIKISFILRVFVHTQSLLVYVMLLNYLIIRKAKMASPSFFWRCSISNVVVFLEPSVRTIQYLRQLVTIFRVKSICL